MAISKNHYYKSFIKAYSQGLKDNPDAHETYKRWMNHKLRHSLLVVKEGLKIMSQEFYYRMLPEETKKQFIDALLFHDYSRHREINPQTGKLPDEGFVHGVESAYDAYQLGERSLNVLVSVMLHDQINYDFLELSDAELKKNKRYNILSTETKEFLQNIRRQYAQTSDDEKKIIKKGLDFVKDADLIANLQNIHFNLRLDSETGKVSKIMNINPQVQKQLYSGGWVKWENVKTLPEVGAAYTAWVGQLKSTSAIKIAKDKKIMEGIRDLSVEITLDAIPDTPQKDVKAVKDIFNKGISLILTKLNKYHHKFKSNQEEKMLKEYVMENKVNIPGKEGLKYCQNAKMKNMISTRE